MNRHAPPNFETNSPSAPIDPAEKVFGSTSPITTMSYLKSFSFSSGNLSR